MTITVKKNIVSPDMIQELLDWFAVQDEYVDDRPDCLSKTPDWQDSEQDWPKLTVKKILDSVLDEEYIVESVIFYHQKTSAFRLHVDSADGNEKTLYKNILIPLESNGDGTTVIFKNKWHGSKARFSKQSNSPFSYKIPLLTGEFEHVDDIRVIDDISKYDITQEQLDYLIDVRSGNSVVPGPNSVRNANYSDIESYNPNLTFDCKIHQQFLNHIDIESLHGLTVEQIYHWVSGEVLLFDRQHIHSTGSTHTDKKGITIFTKRPIK